MGIFNRGNNKRAEGKSVALSINNSEHELVQERKKRSGLLLSIALVLPALLLLYHYLPAIVDYLVYDLFTLSPESRLAEAINFFLYDTVKILILLFLISTLMGIVNAFFPV